MNGMLTLGAKILYVIHIIIAPEGVVAHNRSCNLTDIAKSKRICSKEICLTVAYDIMNYGAYKFDRSK